ncbi:hypothetical protein LguiB_003149 [Lonicera macranthoides]
MGKSSNLLVQFVVVVVTVVVFIAGVRGESGDKPTTVCNVKVSDLAQCLPAISGQSPPPPTKGCCKVMHKVDLKCLCNYKKELIKYGVNPGAAMTLPKKCGLKSPKECTAKF